MSEFKVEREAFHAACAAVSKRVGAGLKTSFRGWATFVMAQIKLSVASRFKWRGGQFRKSFSVRIGGVGGDTEARFASTHKGAKLQEYGGVVRPKNRKFLAIPIAGGPAFTPSGVQRYGFSLYSTLPKTTHSFWFQGDVSGGVLMGRKKSGRNPPAQAWYSLRKSVRIPPRLKMRESVRRAITDLKAQMVQAVNRG